MARRRWAPPVPKTARPLQSLRGEDLKAAEVLLNAGKLALLTVGIGRNRRQYLVPVDSPATPSSTAQTEQ
jgi:hypothetical protein